MKQKRALKYIIIQAVIAFINDLKHQNNYGVLTPGV